jgi:high mobility group protein 2-like 1
LSSYEQDHSPEPAPAKPVPPEKPKKKRAITGYIMFCNENRKKVVESNPPGTKQSLILVQLAKMWATIDPAEKTLYNERAKKLATEQA